MAKEIALYVENHPVVLLKGELGAGKTTLAQMICLELGVKESVTSPTYTIVNEYLSSAQKKIYHFDLYRLEKESELDSFGFLEYLDSGNICLIEWPEMAKNYLIDFHCLEINIQKKNEGREITVIINSTVEKH